MCVCVCVCVCNTNKHIYIFNAVLCFFIMRIHFIILMFYWKAIYQSRHSNKEADHLTSVAENRSRRSTSYWIPFINLGMKEKKNVVETKWWPFANS